MMEMFGRRAVLQMGTVEVDGLRVAFRIARDNKPEPNQGEVSVWNLSRNTRAKLADQEVPVGLQVGYGGEISQLFSGDIPADGISTVREGPDWVTTFRAGDGEKAYRTARIQESFGKGTKLADVLKKAAKQMGVGVGNALSKLADGDLEGAVTEMFGGAVLSGPVPRELDRLLRSYGYEWSIQDGQLQVVERDGHTDDEAVLLRPDTGLIGSPEPGKNGFTKIRSLLQPQILPRRRVKLETASFDGFFVVAKVTHTGDTYGPEWYSEFEAEPL
jgi:hypothetical protein